MMIFYLTVWLHFHASFALKIVGVVVPSEVVAGRDALLQCHYDLEGSSLYALKWYKGSHEFYRFILKEVPPVQTFPWSSITIHHEETRSRLFAAPLAGRVLLRNVTASAEGVYKCEVSTEAPYFDTDYEEANLSVIEVASENPIISWLQGRLDWQYDDVFHFKCSMNGTRPASQLSWLLNGHPVPLSMVEFYDPVLIKGDSAAVRYYSAQLGLRFKMEPHLLLSAAHVDRLELTCISRVGLRKGGGDALIEGRAKWLVQRPAADSTIAGIRLQAAPIAGSTVDNWATENDDDVGVEGGGHQKEDDDDGDNDIRVGNKNNKHQFDDVVSLESDDGSAQSDSENPSRRTQPVVGSHPGRVDNKSSAVNSGNKIKGPLARLHLFFTTSGFLIIPHILRFRDVGF